MLNFNFGDVDAVETKFEEFNLLINEHDDISTPSTDHVLNKSNQIPSLSRSRGSTMQSRSGRTPKSPGNM